MTVGFLLVLIGLQLNFVESYQLSPEATRFWVTRFETPDTPLTNSAYGLPAQSGQNVFQNAAYAMPSAMTGKAKLIQPPKWICWPVLFMGVATVFHGAAIHRGD